MSVAKKQIVDGLFDPGIECGTLDLIYLYDSVEAYKNGKPLPPDVTINQLKMHIYDDWAEVGHTTDTAGKSIRILSPRVEIEGYDKPTRIYPDAPIEGFTPEHGHEYTILVRRYGLKGDGLTREYELIEVLEDKINPTLVDKVCRKVIKKIKSTLFCIVPDDYSEVFNAFDYMSFAWAYQGYSISEIYPGLYECLDSYIELFSDEAGISDYDSVYNRFMEMLDEHSTIKKIQNVYEQW